MARDWDAAYPKPRLLLVDEPVAGMTHQEIGRTAELLMALAGEHSVVAVGHDMDFVRSITRRALLGIGYVPQGRQILPVLTVQEHLEVGLPARRGKGRHVPELVLEPFPALKARFGRRGGDVSCGWQQQLALGRADAPC
jgi:ABC-type branched-subunit amino acid transport system ATPase component